MRALVYRGPASLSGCPEAVASVLASSGFDVRYVGPDEVLALTEEVLAGATVYAQPGGGTLRQGWRRMKRHRRAVRGFVAGGGHYLGFCLGAYLAGATPGFGLLPGDTDQALDTEDDTVIEVDWGGTRRAVFAQDPAALEVDDRASVLARYRDGQVAAAVAPYGAGRVGVVGPHPEATADWFTGAGLTAAPDARDLARDLVARTVS
ncbi:BPL-N domain-containing protein [Actinomycetospora aeridis]|uniref:BPL-N domain-containing protein n=1 Tax=Actinomycetospora aeridis TaxID=3129231 RepID=A0ABU8N005_9PSEU